MSDGWRARIFLVAIALALILFLIPEREEPQRYSFDQDSLTITMSWTMDADSMLILPRQYAGYKYIKLRIKGLPDTTTILRPTVMWINRRKTTEWLDISPLFVPRARPDSTDQ